MIFHRDTEDMRIEVMDDEMSDILRSKTGAERLQIAFGMYNSARRMLTSLISQDHPDWDQEKLVREVARRLSHGAV